MEIGAAQQLARGLMAEHGLHGWRLVLDRARTRAGVCRPARREIGLSRVLTALHSEAEVTDTVLHEIAHALVGAHHGHDAVWRARALAIGCSGVARLPATAPRPATAWLGTCPRGHTTGRHRRPARPASCARCSRRFDPGALLEWRLRGEAVPMSPRYLAELAALRALPCPAPALA
ncbi:SprT-like domain-containing protein [Quadrisphaera sp. DSM 44207]|uniref:SprT-like domain-containing protein n=1 Tax=Quadrisphaera sp. DSM 44207 TaxID=1881057 RepID=UPI00088B446D|nr:SprT-like domain-containing protein [Quadrisphaera sp. DSM 44207]SDQ89373.1 SprT-like family protein [Quadrisphaera sp. DSM 44207]